MDNVVTLIPREHFSFDVWESKNGYHAEAKRNGSLLWEYKAETIVAVIGQINRTLGRLNDSD